MAGVTLYEHAYFSGKSQRFDIGKHDIHTLRIVENDTVSSLRVSVGYRATLYEHGGFRGRSALFGPGDYDMYALERHGFKNDILSSLIVETDGAVTVFEHGYFNGKSQTFGLGRHNIDALTIVGNDIVSSMRVKEGYRAMLFKHANFTGTMATFGPGDHDINSFRSHGFQNDSLSSLVVELEGGKIAHNHFYDKSLILYFQLKTISSSSYYIYFR